MGGADVAEVRSALKTVLNPYEVDEDTCESLVELVSEGLLQDGADGARGLAALLEEQLEPFLIAFGAEPTAIPTAAMQVAVALRGLPELEMQQPKVAKAQESPPVAKASPVAASEAPAAKPSGRAAAAAGTGAPPAPPPAAGDLTLAAFCAAGAKAPLAAAAAGGGAAPAARPGAAGVGGSTAPRTLGDLWASQPDPLLEASKAWLATAPDAGAPAESDGEEVEARKQKAVVTPADRRAQEKLQRRSQRLMASEAAVNAIPAAEDITSSVAMHGMSEAQAEDAASGPRRRGGRGPHKEGPGSRNVHLEGVTISLTGELGSRDILRDADLHLNAGHVYGLIGKNGSGKTTLLRRLAARALPGLPGHLRYGYLAQEIAAVQGQQSALEAVVTADAARESLLKERAELEAALQGADGLREPEALAAAEAAARRFTEVEQELAAIDADGAEGRAREALGQLGFDEASMLRAVELLSGGWRMRLALARVLCGRPDVLLLDEPTNHLDLHGVLWLQEHLRQCWGAEAPKKDRIVVVVSHDRAFLDACVTDIVEIYDCKLRNFPGSYSSYVERVAEEQRCILLRRDEAERQERQAQKEFSALRRKAREHKDDKKVRQLKAKEKKLEQAAKLSSKREFGGDREDILAKLREDVSLRFRFPEAEMPLEGDANYLEMDGAAIRLGGSSILKKVTLTLEPRSRVAVVGGNGAGKSTLMRALAGEIRADEGSRGRGRIHPSYKPGFVSQNHLERQASSLQVNCVGYLRQLLPDGQNLRGDGVGLTKQADDSLLRAHLGNFGLGRDALKKVGYLSGGQRARLSLAAATWWGPSALLLDEPTNHLDVDSLDALTLGLQAFEGPIVVVSHNRGFLEALCDELWVVRDGTVKVCPKGEEAFAAYFAQYVKEVRAALK